MDGEFVMKPIFEFYNNSSAIKIFKNGEVKIGKSPFPKNAKIIINRIPAEIEAEKIKSLENFDLGMVVI